MTVAGRDNAAVRVCGGASVRRCGTRGAGCNKTAVRVRGIFPPRPALAAALGRHLSPLRSRFIQIVLFNKNMPNCICFAFFVGFLPYRRCRRRVIPGLSRVFISLRLYNSYYSYKIYQIVFFLSLAAAPPAAGRQMVCRRQQCAPPARRRKTHGLPQMATRAARSERATRAARKKECIR